MNYTLVYSRLMDRARHRELDGYVERHHVVPRCLGGGNEQPNIVRLTPEEHYVAHQLLVKIHPGNFKVIWSAVAMTNGTRKQVRNNKLYGWLRRQLATRLSEKFTGSKHTDAARAKMRASHLGVKRDPHTVETKAKMSAASLGRKKSEAHCVALGAAKLGKKRGPHSEAHKRGISHSLKNSDRLKAAIRAFSATPEYKAKQAAITTQAWARRRAAEASRSSDHIPAGG